MNGAPKLLNSMDKWQPVVLNVPRTVCACERAEASSQ